MKQEALKLVESLNNETFLDGVSLEWIEPFTYESNGYQCKISFLGVSLWNNANDDREWMDDDEKEHLRKFIVREAKKILADINRRLALI